MLESVSCSDVFRQTLDHILPQTDEIPNWLGLYRCIDIHVSQIMYRFIFVITLQTFLPHCKKIQMRSSDENSACLSVCLSVCQTRGLWHKKLIRRWDSERELSLRRHCTRTRKYNRLLYKFRHSRFLQRSFTKFSEITQCNGHYAVQGHSRSPILVQIVSSLYDFLLVINTNLPPILHRFQVMADYWSNFR